MFWQIVLLILGLALLIKGADWLVSGASNLAKRYQISDLAIGLTIVAFGTSAPEMVVNVYAASQGHPDIVFGNVIGSNNFNLFVILGITGLLSPLVVHSNTVWKEIPISFLAIILVFLMANEYFSMGTKILNQWDGLILLALFMGFLVYIFRQMKLELPPENGEIQFLSFRKAIFLILVGLAGLVIGGRLVVSQAIHMAEGLGVSEKIIGLTIVAAGTSLPELATSVVAVIRKNNDIAVGNIIGSNIFNFLLILSVSALINPLSYQADFNKDLIFLTAGTLFLFLAMFTGKMKKLDRWEAAILLVAYLGYMLWIMEAEVKPLV
ncbi:calcium/sodium antiporter [Echinicola jeungdonensis]|nr:calcium/sodium antiporter [Echinicola jeungdonensis]MDN3668417.1 calcium/sodium antiporter [Echinicola jeungdonensis]